MQENNDSEIKSAHANWLKHPITKAVFDRISSHRARFYAELTQKAFKTESTTPEKIRLLAAGINTIDAVVAICYSHSDIVITPNQQSDL